MNRFADRDRRIVNDCVVQTAGETLFELSHFFSHGIGSRERVRAWELENRNRGRRFSAEPAGRSARRMWSEAVSYLYAGGLNLEQIVIE